MGAHSHFCWIKEAVGASLVLDRVGPIQDARALMDNQVMQLGL